MSLLIRFAPATKLALSITLIVLSILSVASLAGFYPDKLQLQLSSRARVAEALTHQIAFAASNRNVDLIQNTISAVQSRDSEIQSVGLRGMSGQILASTSDHDVLWTGAESERSTQTHAQVPITLGAEHWGTLEIVFAPIESNRYFAGMSKDFLLFSAFVSSVCFFTIYFVLKITLRQLDPARTIPSRVQRAFDSLSDGIAVVDEKDNILLVNQPLAGILAEEESDYLGSKLSDLLWRFYREGDKSSLFPWMIALRENRTVRDVAMNLRCSSGAIVNMLVNASPISTDGHSVNGALVSFKDVTLLERKNRDLYLAYMQLQQTETEIKKQNDQLQYLANHDPLTSCLNRRSLFERFQAKFDVNVASGRPLTCMMLDVDYFKSVNDTYGHAVGDSVIVGLAKLLQATAQEVDLVGRYGGEEFCMVLDGADENRAAEIAEWLRQQVKEQSREWLGQDRSLSISIGIAPADHHAGSVNNAVNNADQALYNAKETGRDRVVQWGTGSFAMVEQAPSVIGSGLASAEPRTVLEPSPHVVTTPIDEFAERLDVSMRRAQENEKLVAVICVSLNSSEELVEASGKHVFASVPSAISKRLNSMFDEAVPNLSATSEDRNPQLVEVEKNLYLFELTDIDDSAAARRSIQRLSDELAVPIEIVDQRFALECSIGAALYPNDGTDAKQLIQNAVVAQTKVKEVGEHGNFRMYSKELLGADQEQQFLEVSVREAIKKREFCLYFQPIIDITNGAVAGAEVLLRSTNDNLKSTSIEAIIRAAEKAGLIEELSNYVCETTFSTINKWKRHGIYLPLVSIKLSVDQLNNKKIVADFFSFANAYQVDPCTIQLELTETAIVTDIKRTADVLRTFQNYGFHIALDDFGTGQSSLSQLLEICPDTIKIDKTFVQSMTSNKINRILVDTIIELSGKIGAKLVSEGVETQEQLEMLLEHGCRYAQGYLFSRPLPEASFVEWLEAFGPLDRVPGSVVAAFRSHR